MSIIAVLQNMNFQGTCNQGGFDVAEKRIEYIPPYNLNNRVNGTGRE